MDTIIIFLRALSTELNYFFRKLRNRRVQKLAESVLTNLEIINAIEGAKTSALFEKKFLYNIRPFKTRAQLFEHALKQVTVDGLHLEMGVYKGDSINALAKLRPNQKFYGFDSFEGLPESWTLGSRKGAFSLGGNLPPVRRNVTLVKGFFQDSLGSFVEGHKDEKIAFMHIDCDLYSATKYLLETMKPLLTKGAVIVFDEYYNYSEWQEGEYKAFAEFIESSNFGFEYIGYIRIGSQVAVRLI